MSAHHYKCTDVNFSVFDVVSSVNKESVDLEYPISMKNIEEWAAIKDVSSSLQMSWC